MTLYRIDGSTPQPLPRAVYAENGDRYSNLTEMDAPTLATFGIVAAPTRPDDTETQTAEWDDETEAWVMVDRPVPPEPTLEEIKAAKIAAIGAAMQARLAEGAAVSGGLHVALVSDTRTDMGAMATTALGAEAGSIPWPDSYALGWITVENVRIPLPTPADGLALASSVGDVYAQIRQHGRDLKDDVLAAEDAAAVAAISSSAGWPA